MLNLDVDLTFHNPKTRSMREHPRPARRRSADAPDAAGDNACTSASTAQPAAAAAARSSFFSSTRRRRRPRQRRRRARRAQSRFALALPSVEQPRPPAAPITRSHRRASFFSQPGDAHVEYDRAGADIVGAARLEARSRPKEDVHPNKHTAALLWPRRHALAFSPKITPQYARAQLPRHWCGRLCLTRGGGGTCSRARALRVDGAAAAVPAMHRCELRRAQHKGATVMLVGGGSGVCDCVLNVD